jgi:hypothetical protein
LRTSAHSGGSHHRARGNHLAVVYCEAVDLNFVVGMAAILPNTGEELKHEVQVETSRDGTAL